MTSSIRSTAVLGAGTMGAQIAAHLGNAGVPVLLLDVTEDIARSGLKHAQKLRPDPFFTPAAADRISIGGLDRDFERLQDADWIIEAIVERADAKRELLKRVDAVRRPSTIVSSNTSGIPIGSLAAGLSEDFKRHWLGTHFFNPPRYLHLLEVIPTPDTDPAVRDRICRFADLTLGKGVVIAKDTPNFIANRIGLFGMTLALQAIESGEYSIEEIDAMTGPAIGRPKSATFRTADIAGIDILAHVARNLVERLTDEQERVSFQLPPLVSDLVERGWMGDKTGQGFYKKQGSDILTLDPTSMTYRPRQAVHLPSLDAVKPLEDVGARVRTLFLGQDRVGAFLRRTLGSTLLYAARVAPAIAHSIDDVDRAMRWGFGWELGPFEIWDAVGVRDVLAALDSGTLELPTLFREPLEKGRNRFRDRPLPPAGDGLLLLRSAKDRQSIVRRNPGASLVDLGDGVLALEFHSKMNAIGADTLQMLHAGVKEAAANFQALVVGTEAPNFSAGANLMLLLMEAQEGNWDEIDLMVRTFQGATHALRYADVPVVACPAGMTLGGGCEMALHSDRVQAAAEAYIGLVETGVGLIPAAGGTKEMLARAVEQVPATARADLLPIVQPVFERIGLATVSTSAEDARRLQYLRPVDGITMNRERLIQDGKALALERVREGYRKPVERHAIPVGGENLRAALGLGIHLAQRSGRITDHDALVARALARILSGGRLPHAATVTEQYILDLEREAFLELCGQAKTRERIQHTLKTGKPLRN